MGDAAERHEEIVEGRREAASERAQYAFARSQQPTRMGLAALSPIPTTQ
jgi:hypothetical protein